MEFRNKFRIYLLS